MKNSIKYCFASIAIVFLLNGCQKGVSVLPFVPQAKQAQHEVIKKCSALNQSEADLRLAYLVEEFNSVDKDDWYPVSEVGKDQKIYRGLSQWSKEDLKKVILENTTPSGDWSRIDEYCFNKDGKIAEIYSDLHTFYSDPSAPIEVIQTRKYYSDGTVESSDTELFDLHTKNPVEPNEVAYMANPPQLVGDYKELARYLELPAENLD